MKKIVFLLFVAFLLSCHFNTFYTKSNDQIPIQDVSSIKIITDKIYNDLCNHRMDYILSIMDSSTIDQNVRIIDSAYAHLQFNNQVPLSPLDQYLIKNGPDLRINTVLSTQHGYTYKFQPDLLSYVYIAALPIKGQKYTWLLSCVFHKSDDKWKLYSLCIGYYLFNGYTAEEYYNFSKQKYEQGKVLSAYFYSHFAMNAIEPGLDYFHYLNEGEIKKYGNKTIMNSLIKNKIFPIAFKNIQSEPEILDINTRFYHSTLYSCIFCKSKTAVSDTIALKKEAYKINEELGTLVPEINIVNDSIAYRFYYDLGNNIQMNDPHYTVFVPVVR